MTRIVEFAVQFVLPPGATMTQAKEYVLTEVMAGCGARVCDVDPMFDLDRSTVKVRKMRDFQKPKRRSRSTPRIRRLPICY